MRKRFSHRFTQMHADECGDQCIDHSSLHLRASTFIRLRRAQSSRGKKEFLPLRLRGFASSRFNFFVLLLAIACQAQAEPNLRIFKTEHYEVHTDLDPAFARELGDRMEAMYAEYSARLADFTGAGETPVLPVYLFSKHDDYGKFIGNRFTNTGGVFLAGQRNLLASFLEGQGRDAMRRTLQHEAFHQFAHFHISPDLPVWLNEGLAQLFEEGIWNGRQFVLGQVPPRRLRQLQADVSNRRLIDFKTLLSLTPEQWGDILNKDAERASVEYNQSWAMVHYLVFSGERDFRRRLNLMLRYVHEGQNGTQAFTTAFSPNFTGFQDLFTSWSGTLKATDTATLLEHQDVLGDMLALLKSKGQTFEDIPHFRQHIIEGGYELHYSRGQLKWNTERDGRVYFANLLGQTYSSNDLKFEANDSAPLPDIVCHADGTMTMRTRFYLDGGKIVHEVLIEPR